MIVFLHRCELQVHEALITACEGLDYGSWCTALARDFVRLGLCSILGRCDRYWFAQVGVATISCSDRRSTDDPRCQTRGFGRGFCSICPDTLKVSVGASEEVSDKVWTYLPQRCSAFKSRSGKHLECRKGQKRERESVSCGST